MPPANLCRAVWLGDMDYLEARDLQLSLVENVHSGQEPNTMLMLEHPHVYTKGRLSKESDVLLPEEDLAAKGINIYETDRGGQVTYHGPGQLVVYPIVNLRDWGGPVKYVRALEQVVIATLAEMGITANCESGNTGVWTDQGKIAAIGIAVRYGITRHGFALNVYNELSGFRCIVPCGLDEPVTSLHELGWTGDRASLQRDTAVALQEAFTATASSHGLAVAGRPGADAGAGAAPAFGAHP